MSKEKGTTFRRFFIHWRSGKRYDAWDYGHKAWPLGRSRSK
ncbi:MAG TPA: hypothetical protein VFI95_16415 [Terriglobales bacterium]|nr:hypothetical protein [Terriglobales bacterium]